MRIKFQYNLNSDARNWQRIISGESRLSHRFNGDGNFKFLSKKVQEVTKEEGIEIIKNYLIENNKQRNDLIKQIINSLNKTWFLREDIYFQALERILNKKVDCDEYKADITTATIAPYYWPNNWFMVSLYYSLPKQITTIAHEVFHIEFLKNYQELLEGLDKNKVFEITEAITCLLNVDLFKKVIDLPDEGYANHKEIRDKILSMYNKNREFREIIENLKKS